MRLNHRRTTEAGNSVLPRAGRVGGGPVDPFPERAIEGNPVVSGNGSRVIGQRASWSEAPHRSGRPATPRSNDGERS